MTAPVVAFEGVSKSFGAGTQRVQALSQISLNVFGGGITGLLGPDGAGKTTLMRLAAGLLLPDAGTVMTLGWDSRKSAGEIQGSVGYMPQRFGLYEDLTVKENLDLFADLHAFPSAARPARYAELLRLTGLGPFGGRLVGDLSGGMKQKLGLSCTLIRPPRLLLLDEPTVGVDPISRRELWVIVTGLVEKEGMAALVSTAYLDEAERCQHVFLIQRGQIRDQGSPASMRDRLTGRSFVATSPTLPRRAVLVELKGRREFVDTVVQREGVRVVLHANQVLPELPSVVFAPVPPRFEDAFMESLYEPTLVAAQSPLITATTTPRTVAQSSDQPVIEVRDLRRFFGAFEAVKGISFRVERGQIFGLLGANGAGKTTTFRMLCGLLPPSSGSLMVAGVDGRKAIAEARSHIGYMSQKFSLYTQLSVSQNLTFFAAVYGLRGARCEERLLWAAQAFELTPYLGTNAADLPLGFKQRLALACALIHEPDILFLDEPTSGVDPLARREFWGRINALADSGVTIMVTTHFMEEAEYCDALVLMSLGSILAAGTPAGIRAQARSHQLPNPSMDDAFVALIEAHEAQTRRVS
ncbi:MAG: ATP-binding cassette domain-containing protein [Acidiferrobacter sp.]